MATAYVYQCNTSPGTQIENGVGLAPDGRLVPHCPDGGTWTQIEYVEEIEGGGGCCTLEQLELIGINPADVAHVYFWGFGTICLWWGLGYVGGIAKKAIDQL